MKRVFVDTSGWFAAASRGDSDHCATRRFLKANRLPLITSDYVLDETVTLLQARIGHGAAVRFLDSLCSSPSIGFVYLEKRDINDAIGLFRARPDKGWSFTDCTSFVLMQRQDIDTALTLDEHFRQAGFDCVP